MNNKQFEYLLDKLQDKLIDTTNNFFYENFDDEPLIDDIINILISSYTSSLFSIMRHIAHSAQIKDEILINNIESFIYKMIEHIKSSDNVKNFIILKDEFKKDKL